MSIPNSRHDCQLRDSIDSLINAVSTETISTLLHELEADACEHARFAVPNTLDNHATDDSAVSAAISAASKAAAAFLELRSGIGCDRSCRVLKELHDEAWSRLHPQGDKSVDSATSSDEGSNEAMSSVWRDIFAFNCLLRGIALATSAAKRDSGICPDVSDSAEALKLFDLGLIVGGPEARAAYSLFAVAKNLACGLRGANLELVGEKRRAEDTGIPSSMGSSSAKSPKRRRIGDVANNLLAQAYMPLPKLQRKIKEIPHGTPMNLETFLLDHLAKRLPIVFRGACAAWPAIERWAKTKFWCDTEVGCRYVPVELDYWVDQGFKLMTISDFVQHCLDAEGRTCTAPGLSGGGYLAQHSILDHIPSLESDIATPDIALCGPEGHLLRRIFFGPQGTVTPLHFDPYENAFCQVVGRKYVRLYAPEETPKLYARNGSDVLQNNSLLEPPDLLEGEAAGAYGKDGGRFEEFPAAKFLEVVLEPGDMLYLPLGWWHFVKSFSSSISLAFQFT